MRSIVVISAVFTISLFSGYAFALSVTDMARDFVNQTFQQFEFVGSLEHYQLFAFIFANNALKAFMSMILGIAFGIIPVLFVMLNGMIIGIVVGVVGEKMGMFTTLALLIPHGILEIPAILISSSYGLDLGIDALKRLRGDNIDLNSSLLRNLKKFARIPLPLLIIAAFIETYITPLIAGI